MNKKMKLCDLVVNKERYHARMLLHGHICSCKKGDSDGR